MLDDIPISAKESPEIEKATKWWVRIEFAVVILSLLAFFIPSISYFDVYSLFYILVFAIMIIGALSVFLVLGPRWIYQQYTHFRYTNIVDYLLFAFVCFIAWLLFPLLMCGIVNFYILKFSFIEDNFSLVLLIWLTALVTIGAIVLYFHAIRIHSGKKKYSLIPILIFYNTLLSRFSQNLNFHYIFISLLTILVTLLTILPGYQLVVSYLNINPDYKTPRFKELINDWKAIGYLFIAGAILAELTLLTFFGEDLEIVLMNIIWMSLAGIIVFIAMLYQYPEMVLINKIDLLKAHNLYRIVEEDSKKAEHLEKNSSSKLLEYLDFIYTQFEVKG